MADDLAGLRARGKQRRETMQAAGRHRGQGVLPSVRAIGLASPSTQVTAIADERIEHVTADECPGERLGRMMAAEPELTRPAATEEDHAAISRFVDYITADGFDVPAMVTRMERLQFETIVTGKSHREVLADTRED